MTRRKHQGRHIAPRLMQWVQQLQLPPRLFKFLEGNWANQMITRGSVRIGTLHEYRNQEKYSHGVVDTGEGTITQREAISVARGDQLSPIAARAIAVRGAAQNLTIHGLTVVATSSEPEQHIYCLSKLPSWDAEINPKYTACIEIYDVKGFLIAMIEEVRRHSGRVRVDAGDVVYAGREHVTRNDGGKLSGGPPARAALLKPAEYVSQQEYRFVFTSPAGLVVKPIFAKIRAITDFIRLHSVRPDES